MIKILKYFFFSIFLSFFIAIVLALIFAPEDREWVKCSDEKDLYRYVYDGWKIDKVLKNGDITYTDSGQKLFYKGEYPQIYLSKNDRIKALNFGWRCYYLVGAELNFKKNEKTFSDCSSGIFILINRECKRVSFEMQTIKKQIF